MKKLYFLLFCLITTVSFGQDLIITGVIDGPLPGGFPKGIELFVVNNIADLSIYGLEKAGNGGPSTGAQTYTFPADSYSAGAFIYVGKTDANSAPAFTQYIGVTLTYQDDVVNHNGDDTMLLYKNGVVVDGYGVVGEDGTGMAWESLDGWAYRNSAAGPNATFTASEWSFSGPNALDGCDLSDDTGTNSACASVFPAGTYTNVLAISQQQLLDGFSVYPNPVRNGLLNVQSPSNTVKNIHIFDVIGQQVYQRNTTKNQINISNLNAGMYFVKVQQDGKIATRKLVVE